jgi:hypothetical protein
MTQQAPTKAQLWGGRVASALPVLALVMSSMMKLSHAAQLVPQFVGKFGYSETTLTPLGIVELVCAIAYAIPKTRAIGAVLVTGYLGGAIATHVRIGDPFVAPLVLGVLAWLGLFLTDTRVRELLPLRRA